MQACGVTTGEEVASFPGLDYFCPGNEASTSEGVQFVRAECHTNSSRPIIIVVASLIKGQQYGPCHHHMHRHGCMVVVVGWGIVTGPASPVFRLQLNLSSG